MFIGLKSPAIWPAIRFPKADATNHIPIIWAANLFGASFVVAESPTGDSVNSTKV